MDKKDTIVTDVVIQALKMDDTIKRQEIIIERLKAENRDMKGLINSFNKLLLETSPEMATIMDLFCK